MTADDGHGGVLADIARWNTPSRKPMVRHEARVGIQRLELGAPLVLLIIGTSDLN